MTNPKLIRLTIRLIATVPLAVIPLGCSTDRGTVYAITGTTIGVHIHQKDGQQTPEVKIGYNRAEIAIVPTDKVDHGPDGNSNTNNGGIPGGSSTNSAEVLMEINAAGSLALGSAYQGGVYQRLAVGKTAVSQPGAALMMAKDKQGKIAPGTAEAIRATAAVNALPTPTLDAVVAKRGLQVAYDRALDEQKAEFEKAAASVGYPAAAGGVTAFQNFLAETTTKPENVTKIQAHLKSKNIPF